MFQTTNQNLGQFQTTNQNLGQSEVFFHLGKL